MDFLRFVLSSIFIGLAGIFLYRYENLNRFQIMPYHSGFSHSGFLIFDRKINRVTHFHEKGFSILIKGNEPFLQEYYQDDSIKRANFENVLPIPVDGTPDLFPPEMPSHDPLSSQNLETQHLENYQESYQANNQENNFENRQKASSHFEKRQPHSSFSEKVIQKSKDAAYNAIASPANLENMAEAGKNKLLQEKKSYRIYHESSKENDDNQS